MTPLSNGQLAELLAQAAAGEARGTNRHRALARASRAAFSRWPEEAADLLANGRSLTELRAVGPWVAGVMARWFERAEQLEPVEPPPLRRGFLTLAEVRATLAEHPDWLAGLRGDLQMHTTYSDGAASVREMAEECAAYGYEFVAITDHSKGLPIANGMDEARLARQAEEIREVRAELGGRRVPLAVLHGLEMNLSPEGEGDMEPEALRSLDLVLGAFHSKLRTTEDQTKRYAAALRNPRVHVLAHPRGRRWGARLGLQADWPAVFEEAVAQNTALEIDAFRDRQDLDVDLLRLAGRRVRGSPSGPTPTGRRSSPTESSVWPRRSGRRSLGSESSTSFPSMTCGLGGRTDLEADSVGPGPGPAQDGSRRLPIEDWGAPRKEDGWGTPGDPASRRGRPPTPNANIS